MGVTHVDFVTYSLICISPLMKPLLSILIMSVLIICLANMYNTKAPNILRWIFIWFYKRLRWVKFTFFYVPTRYHFADILTKGLTQQDFFDFKSSISLYPPRNMTRWGCHRELIKIFVHKFRDILFYVFSFIRVYIIHIIPGFLKELGLVRTS